MDAGDAASRGARGMSDAGSGHSRFARIPLARWRRRSPDTTNPAQRTAGERISSVRPKSRRPRSNAWIMNGVPPNGASARGYRGASRKPTACGTPVDPGCPKVLAHYPADYGIGVQAQGCIGHPAFRALSRRRGRGMAHPPGALRAAGSPSRVSGKPERAASAAHPPALPPPF